MHPAPTHTVSPVRTGRGWLTTLVITAALALLDTGLTPVYAQSTEPTDPRVQAILDQDPAIEHLGTPVTSHSPSQSALGQEDGRWMNYQVYKGVATSEYPAVFAVTDVETGEILRTCTLEGAEHARNLNKASDGKIYWGTFYNDDFWQYDPETQECRNLGVIDPNEGNSEVFGLSPGPDGTMFIGAYPDSRLYQYDPATDEITLLHAVDPDEEYIHSIAYREETDTLYVGTGGQHPTLWSIADGGHGEVTLFADDTTVPGLNDTGEWFGRMDIVEDRIVAQVGLRMLVMQFDGTIDFWEPESSNRFFGHHSWAGTEPGQILYSGPDLQLWQYDVATKETATTGLQLTSYVSNAEIAVVDGTPMLYGTEVGNVIIANLKTAEIVSRKEIDFQQPTVLRTLINGPDNTLWIGGAYGGLAKADKTGENHEYKTERSGFFSGVTAGDKLYLGSYGNAQFWDMPLESGQPKLITEGVKEGQDRPFTMDYNPDRGEVYMGTVAGYGKNQGGLMIYDTATEEVTWLTTEITVDQSVISVAYNPVDQLVYIGTTLDGGNGAPEAEPTRADLIVWDPETREVVSRIEPVEGGREGITGLAVDPDGKVWGVGEDSLFVYDPATGEAEVTGTVAPRYRVDGTYWKWATLGWSESGQAMYGHAGSNVFRIDPETGEPTRLVTGVSEFVVDPVGDLYFSAGAHLFRYPGTPEETPTPTPTQGPTQTPAPTSEPSATHPATSGDPSPSASVTSSSTGGSSRPGLPDTGEPTAAAPLVVIGATITAGIWHLRRR
ncbi:ligand-binding sensor domain-containing protein [Parenemella sanctibonifatiensis]|uniref:Uncharacterized protein n=1 Tax=Parenemella sanctibonifatiensis TaxID=2016505 RepID=A0A255EKQ1_9ACTN|nr:hypothetical protein [Parenemella sanctibonifatiensis]OYN92096.1 hypothetical protein CGZ91_00840 [Parenemella sanctibonifatiensis]